MNEKLDIKNYEAKSLKEQFVLNYLAKLKNPFINLTVQAVAKDLHIGINQAYELFKQDDFPSIKVGKRKKVTLASYLLWKISKDL